MSDDEFITDDVKRRRRSISSRLRQRILIIAPVIIDTVYLLAQVNTELMAVKLVTVHSCLLLFIDNKIPHVGAREITR